MWAFLFLSSYLIYILFKNFIYSVDHPFREEKLKNCPIIAQREKKSFQLVISPKEFGNKKDHQADILKNSTMKPIEIATELFWKNKNMLIKSQLK